MQLERINEFVADHKRPLLAFVLYAQENQKKLKNLLAEGIPLRDMRTIAETIAEHAAATPETLRKPRWAANSRH